MVKYIHVFRLVLLLVPVFILSGCVKNKIFGISGRTPGIKNGVVIIKNEKDSVVFGVNIKGGKFAIDKVLNSDGYYRTEITITDKKDWIKPFELYLEDGRYSIETNYAKPYQYPKIASSSKIQLQLSKFYSLLDSLNSKFEDMAMSVMKQINENGNKLPKQSFNKMLSNLSINQRLTTNNSVIAFTEFAKRYPGNDIGIHLMDVLHYRTDPLNFYAAFKLLKPDLKNSERGKYIGNELAHLIKLIPGVKAPDIYGKTLDGKSFDPSMIHGKLTLVEFWRSESEVSRTNHQKLIAVLAHEKNNPNVEMLSVSFDSKSETWAQAVKDDRMHWLQISDLKGILSPNVGNWMITRFPTYYLVDSHWNIIKGDLYSDNIDAQLSYYLNN